MKITDAFIGEHAVLYPQLGEIERAAPACSTAGEARARAALLTAALKSHADLEEELLFVEMESLPEAGGPIAVMRSEHLDIEESLSRARETDDLEEATDLLLHVVDVARPHFAKEEDVLFPMAGELLDEATLLALGDRWAGRRLGGPVRTGAAFTDA
jgi:iron-sulfur cluster repair protein YtfE (RIC family)